MITATMFTESVNAAFETTSDRWTTCDWFTEFGVLRLNLSGLRSVQLERVAHATSGQESQEWWKAAAWVRRIEDDAVQAQSLARQARDACLRHNFARAIALAEQAVELESTWHREPVWGSLLQAIRCECGVQ